MDEELAKKRNSEEEKKRIKTFQNVLTNKLKNLKS